MQNPIYNPRFRSLAIQCLALIATLGFVLVIVSNTMENLAKQGIASGFGFLSATAGFDIIMHLIDYAEESSYGRAFIVAVINTLTVSALGILLATFLGFALGIARLSHNWLVAKIATIYVEIVRNVPLLLQLFFWYFAVLRSLPGPRQSYEIGGAVFLNIRGLYLPRPVFGDGSVYVGFVFFAALALAIALHKLNLYRQRKTGLTFRSGWVGLAVVSVATGLVFVLTGMPISLEAPVLTGFNFERGYVLIPEFVALLLALTIYTAAFIGEIVRAGILAVGKGQSEAALSLGLNRGQTLRFVVIPQALRIIVPPLTSQHLNLTKNSSLAAAIAYPDVVLVFAGTVLMQTGQAVEVIGLTMAVYLTISLLISVAMNIYNRRIATVDR